MKVPAAYLTQREFSQAQADAIAAELDLNQIGYPIINMRGGVPWVVDGQHRIDALKTNGFANDVLDCEVYEDLTDAEMADVFIGRSKSRHIQPYAKFRVSCTAGYTRELSILRAVESNGQKIARKKTDGISAVGALGNVFDRSGDVVLGQVIRTVNLGFNGDPLAFDASILEGLGLSFHRYNGRINEKNLAHRLATLRGARELLRKAEALRERTGNQKKHCVAAVIVDTYNKPEAPTSKNRLPSWWKEGAGA